MIKFDINLIFGFIDIIVFYLLMRKFLFGRIQQVMAARKELLASALDDAKKKNEEADEKLKDYEEKIASCEAEGKQIIAEAKEKANEQAQHIIDDAKAEAQELREKAIGEIEAESEKARQDVKEQIASLAVEVAEKVVKNSVSDEINSSVIDEFLSGDGNEQ